MVRWPAGTDHHGMYLLATDSPTLALGDRSRAQWLASWARRLSLDTTYLLLGFPAGVVTFTVAVTGWATALGLAITLIGLPIALATIVVCRAMAWGERQRAALVLGGPIRGRYAPPVSGRVVDRLKALFADAQTWKDLGWHLLLLPLGILGATVAVACWSLTLWGLTLPLWWWAIEPARDFGSFNLDSWWWAALGFLAGVVSIPLTVALIRGSAAATGALAKIVLGPGSAELEERVEVLTETRAGAVDAAQAELQRIERDLHDGAQARLVALALDLGMAEERFDRDPEGARELVDKARGEAKLALSELRDLARGLRPALLAERGLAEAVRAMAARTPLPTSVSADVPADVSPAVEAAAYFVVAEALTNAVKHSGASRAWVRVGHEGGRLAVEVSDDGHGGADQGGAGLSGLRKRVEALDGTLRIASPPGGPTMLHAEMPCAP
jgi:signal transduction histidine kinase